MSKQIGTRMVHVNVRVKMPCIFEVDDYHEFNNLQYYLQKLFPYHKVIVEEVLGHPDGEHYYKGIAYLAGQEKDFANLKAELEEAYGEQD